MREKGATDKLLAMMKAQLTDLAQKLEEKDRKISDLEETKNGDAKAKAGSVKLITKAKADFEKQAALRTLEQHSPFCLLVTMLSIFHTDASLLHSIATHTHTPTVR